MKIKTTNTVLVLTFTLISYLLSGCSGCQQTKEKELIGEGISFSDINIIDSVDAVIMALPSPEEIIQYIKNNKVEFDESLLLDNDISMKISSVNEKKQILGMYLADLAYLSSFSQTEYVPDLVKTIDYLMKDLELSPVVSEDIRSKLLNSSFASEDVFNISQQFYDSVINYLFDIDDGKTLTLISIGTFYEVMYISTNIHSDYELYKSSIYKIGEQKLLFEDLLTMTGSYKGKGLEKIYYELKLLEEPFNAIQYESEIVDVYNTEDSILHIQSIGKSDMSNENFTEFRKVINKLRNNIQP